MSVVVYERPADGLASGTFRRVTVGSLAACYRGSPYLRGFAAGEESVAELLRRLGERSLAASCADLRGVFGLCLHDTVSGRLQAVVDNLGLYHLYHDGSRLSFDFLELLDARAGAGEDNRIRDDRVVEYIAHGVVHGGVTPVDGVATLDGTSVLTIEPSSSGPPAVSLDEKVLPAPAGTLNEEFAAVPGELEAAFGGSRLSADVTGGFDTRLLLAAIGRTTLDYELAVSGRDDSEDVLIARRVAAILGRELLTTTHRVPADVESMDAEVLRGWAEGDGLSDPLRTHRLMQHNRARVAHGSTVLLHGGGGALYKDFLFLQDFPFFGNRPPNYERLYRLRVSPLSTRSLWTEEGARHAAGAREKLISLYAGIDEQRDNVRAYVAAYGFLRSPLFYGREYSNRINAGLDVVAPYLERHHVVAGLEMPVRARLINAWHREMISRLDPRLAALPTTEFYAATSGPRFALQLPRYLHFQARRGFRKAMQTTFGKSVGLNVGADANNEKSLYETARQCPSIRRGVEALKARGLLREDLEPEDMTNLHLGRAAGVGLLLAR